MPRSKERVRLDNIIEEIQAYRESKQNVAFARFAHLVMGKLYQPHITFDDTGIGAEAAIQYQLDRGALLNIAPNHLTRCDQYVVVSVAQQVKVLHPLRAHTNIPAEFSIFNKPGLAGAAQNWGARQLGGRPIIRKKDIEKLGVEYTPEVEEQHMEIIREADDADVYRMIKKGIHLAGFYEGTRNRNDHRVVQPLKKGIAHTLLRVAKDRPVATVPMGMYYGGEPTDYYQEDVPAPKNPDVHIGMPIEVDPNMTPGELVALVHPAMQACVDVAVRSSLQRDA